MNKISVGLILCFFLGFTSASAEVNPDSLINIFQRLETLENKVRELHGENEVLNHQLTELKKSQKQGFLAVDERIDGLSNSGAGNEKAPETSTISNADETVKIVDYKPEVKAPAIPASAEETKKTIVKDNASKKVRAPTSYEKETYQAAYDLMKKSPSGATRAFKQYIKMQPDSPLAANSQYWIGEIMYSHNNYKGAVEEFVKVLQDYKYSAKAPDAAIKLGYSFYALKNWSYARRTFEDVLKYFPGNANAVKLAKKRLEKMKVAGN